VTVKAYYIGNKGDQRKLALEVAKEEIERQKATVCVNCEQSIGNQVMAMVLKVLHDEYGFGKQRLQNVIECTEGLFLLCAVDGKRFNAVQAVMWLKDSMGIDLGSDNK
jgi:hypothetical protein